MPSLLRTDTRAVSVEHSRRGFDLDELMVVAERGDAEQRARGIVIAERVTDDLPGRHEVGLVGGSDQYAGGDDIFERCARVAEGDLHVLDALRGLRGNVALTEG